MLLHRTAIQRDLNRLDIEANRTFVKLIEDKGKVLHLERNTFLQRYSLGTAGLEQLCGRGHGGCWWAES